MAHTRSRPKPSRAQAAPGGECTVRTESSCRQVGFPSSASAPLGKA